MQYLGAKKTIAAELANVLENLRPATDAMFVDLFCGSAAVAAAMSGQRILNDACPALINMYRAYQAGTWRPPSELSEADYKTIRHAMDIENPLTAFAAFGCSYGGKWFGGYARDKNPETRRNFAGTAGRSLKKIMDRLDSVLFTCHDYRLFPLDVFSTTNPPPNILIYCDPPYKGTTTYGGMPKFDTEAFWTCMRAWRAAGCIIAVSEYEAPPDWREVWTRPVRKSRFAGNKVERLFV